MATLDTNKIFPIREYTHTNPFTKKVTIGYTRSGYHEGKFWSDADINYYEAMAKLHSRIEFMNQKRFERELQELIDESVEVL